MQWDSDWWCEVLLSACRTRERACLSHPTFGRWGNHEEGKEVSASACTVWFPFEPFDSERRRNSAALFPLRSTSSYWNPVPRRGRHFSLYLNKQWFLPCHFHGIGRKRQGERRREENKTQSVIHRKRFKEKVKGWRDGGGDGSEVVKTLRRRGLLNGAWRVLNSWTGGANKTYIIVSARSWSGVDSLRLPARKAHPASLFVLMNGIETLHCL